MHSGLSGGQEGLQRRGVHQVESYLALAVVHGTIPGNCLFQTLPQSLRARPWPPPDSSGSSQFQAAPRVPEGGEAWLLLWDLQASSALCREKLTASPARQWTCGSWSDARVPTPIWPQHDCDF